MFQKGRAGEGEPWKGPGALRAALVVGVRDEKGAGSGGECGRTARREGRKSGESRVQRSHRWLVLFAQTLGNPG